MISDTTISAAQGCGSEMRDKFRMNFFIALPGGAGGTGSLRDRGAEADRARSRQVHLM